MEVIDNRAGVTKWLIIPIKLNFIFLILKRFEKKIIRKKEYVIGLFTPVKKLMIKTVFPTKKRPSM